MPTQTPSTDAAALVAFAVVGGLMRKLVAQQILTAAEAAEIIEGLIADLRTVNQVRIRRVIPVLEKMLQEYRNQTR